MMTLTLRELSFAYEHSSRSILYQCNLSFGQTWSGLIGPNGCGKSTLLKLLSGALQPTAGEIIGQTGFVAVCPQEMQAPPDELAHFFAAYDREALSLKSTLGLHEMAGRNWGEQSFGEQKRLQLACALWQKPDVLLVDEPSNHLDRVCREVVIRALASFRGVGVLVSHDRELLNTLCTRSVLFVGERIHEIDAPCDEALAQLEGLRSYGSKQRELIKRKAAALHAELVRVEALNQHAKRRLSKSSLHRKDHDGKAKVDSARLSDKDASFGQKKVSLAQRIEHLGEERDSFAIDKSYAGAIHFGAEARAGKVLVHAEAGVLNLPSGGRLHGPELVVRSGHKVGLVGLNGFGKSSFITHLLASGAVKSRSFCYLHQELGVSATDALRERFAKLTKEEEALLLQIIARLGSDAKEIRTSLQWSAGEARKLAIALAIVGGAELLILDEPTNHLDLPSIVQLEKALAESQLAVIVVSHDAAFIEGVCDELWEISKKTPECDAELAVRLDWGKS